MKKSTVKKVNIKTTLRRETVRILAGDGLADVRGGQDTVRPSLGSCNTCGTNGCPIITTTSQFASTESAQTQGNC